MLKENLAILPIKYFKFKKEIEMLKIKNKIFAISLENGNINIWDSSESQIVDLGPCFGLSFIGTMKEATLLSNFIKQRGMWSLKHWGELNIPFLIQCLKRK